MEPERIGWVDVDEKSRQHDRIKWVELPEEDQPDTGYTDGSLIVSIKTHSSTDGVEYKPVRKVLVERLLESSDYDGAFQELIHMPNVVEGEHRKPITLNEE